MKIVLTVALLAGLAIFAPNHVAVAQAPRVKAIWEPVNFKGDIEFTDVQFINEDTGWVSGGASVMAGGVILFTKDAGRNWEVQYGDPQSSDRGVSSLRILDAKHGWAVQGSSLEARLLSMPDGQNWGQAGSIETHYTDLAFPSEKEGVYSNGAQIFRSQDGGRKWQPVASCALQAEIEGLTKKIECQFHALHFPSAAVGYAAAGSVYLKDMFFVFKTMDGGQSWQSSTVPGDQGEAEDIVFTDTETGFVRTGYPDSGRLFRTTDGGRSWSGIGGSPGKKIKFVDREVGWSFHYNKLSFTTNGGTRWTSRNFAFPTSVRAFSIPSRRRAYVVGEHGMIYRYSIVPIEYTAKGMIEAPMMPAK